MKAVLSIPECRVGDNGAEQVPDSMMLTRFSFVVVVVGHKDK